MCLSRAVLNPRLNDGSESFLRSDRFADFRLSAAVRAQVLLSDDIVFCRCAAFTAAHIRNVSFHVRFFSLCLPVQERLRSVCVL